MASFVPGTCELRARLSGALVIAVDLGFAERDETCGIAWHGETAEQAESSTFGGCARRVAELLRAASAAEAALIIEAPLSGSFNAAGSPVARDYGSKRDSGRSLESGRGWYYGAGASVALGAVFFVRRLRELLAASDVTVALFEGFVSFKQKKTDHVDDARKLLECFANAEVQGHVIRAHPDGETVTIFDLLGEDAPVAPLVLIPPRSGCTPA